MDECLIAGIACLFLFISSRLGRLLGNTFTSQAWEPLAMLCSCTQSLQSYPTLWDCMDCSPPGWLLCLWDSPGMNTGVPSDAQPSNTLGPALLQNLHKETCPEPAAVLLLFTPGALLLTLHGSSICPLIRPMCQNDTPPTAPPTRECVLSSPLSHPHSLGSGTKIKAS